ncbi:hypothetical protein C1H46_045660 [Malus baccata]|uniref:Uncharacterized protein n=1 Tax=Malus baccata TaxID=106549 RepID=A0A540K3I7_MALBA|nr:hypothetical protein C1H46_045660 [Malus baccata]
MHNSWQQTLSRLIRTQVFALAVIIESREGSYEPVVVVWVIPSPPSPHITAFR